MTHDTKRKTLILLGLLMTATVIIAASLSHLELRPGLPLPRLENHQLVLGPAEAEALPLISISEFFKVIFALVLTAGSLYVLYRTIGGIGWKDFGSVIQSVLVVFLIVSSLIFLVLLLPGMQRHDVSSIEIPTPADTPLVTSPLGSVPLTLLWLVGIALLAGSILLAVWLFASRGRRETSIDLVRFEAEKAWQALIAGQDLKNVIINCYRQMGLIFQREQGIERRDFMTTREFEDVLETAGVPHDPIHQLTGLFEAVRYGNGQPSSLDEQTAIRCFQAIVSYCRDHKQAG